MFWEDDRICNYLPQPPTNSSSSVHICTPYPYLPTLFQQFLSYNWGEKIAITTSEMISWNVSSGTGITWICAPDVLAVTERVNTSDGQRMTGWPLGSPWRVDRGGPLWWRNSASMKEEERERDGAWGEWGWETGTRHPEDLSSLIGCWRGWSTGLDCS